MDYQEFVNKLAFGIGPPKPEPYLGLYISPETIELVQGRLDKAGKPVVEQVARITVPGSGGGQAPAGTMLNVDFLEDANKLADLLRKEMGPIAWKTRDVVVSLSNQVGLLRCFAMPTIERRFWFSAVPLEAKKHVPLPFDQLQYDYQVFPLAPDAGNKARQAVLMGVIQKTTLVSILKLLTFLGLNLRAIEIAPSSVLRMLEAVERPLVGKAHCHVHFDGGRVRIMVADRSLPVFLREVFLGQAPGVGERRKIDAAGCIAFVQKQLAVGTLAQMRVSGSVENLAAWAQGFSQDVGIEAKTQDLAVLTTMKSGDWGSYAALGACLRSVAPGPLNIDLGAVGRVSEEESCTARDILIAGVLAALFFTLFGAARLGLCAIKAGELRRFKNDPEVAAAFAGKKPAAIQEMLSSMQKAIDAAPPMESGPRAVDLLKDIVDSLPERVWLTNVSLMLPSLGTDSTLTLQGQAAAGGVSEEQGLALKFREQLARAPVLAKAFPTLQVTVGQRGGNGGEGGTPFSVMAGPKHQ